MDKTPKKGSQNNKHPSTLKVLMHDKHPHLMYLAQKGKKKANSNKMPKTLMLSNMQQKSLRREKPEAKPKSDQAEHLQKETLEMK